MTLDCQDSYFDGFLSGCDDGDFDCSNVAARCDELEVQEAADAVTHTNTMGDVQ